MRKILFIDYERCTGCELCVLYCSFKRAQTFSRARSAVNIIRWEEKGMCVPSMCEHCEEPLCALVCPVNAISKDEETGIVRRDEDTCIGCKRCMMVCPFGAPAVDPVTGKVFKCDLCGGEPVCAQVCPTEAIQYLKADRVGLSRKRKGMEELASVMSFALAKTEGGGQE